MALRSVIEQMGVSPDACADALGIDSSVFSDWLSGQRDVPDSYARFIAAALGVKADSIRGRAGAKNSHAAPPAIWFKFRGTEFSESDRECILLLRRLGDNANQLENALSGQINKQWHLMFDQIRSSVDLQSSPQEQGKIAAKLFCELRQFGSHARGSGEILRENIRSLGVLVIESPVPHSQIEGCSFYVGESGNQRPCIFANNYRNSWFRRNITLMHELAHAIFDQADGGKVDLSTAFAAERAEKDSVSEIRAQTFAKETLVPVRLLGSILSKHNLSADSLDQHAFATLITETGVEKKTIIEVLRDHNLASQETLEKYEAFDLASLLKQMTDHALSTKDFIAKVGTKAASDWLNKRFTVDGRIKLLLPVPYVKAVLDAVERLKISVGRACELLMIDRYTFAERFPQYCEEAAE